ncbi:MAG: class I tRNA ligase family protein, partial [bacterium]|nr:class I tRNA ligase family protein [bacterium]
SQTMYVWADALSNYISGYGGISAWEAHPADVHVIGKDILRFHAAIWPAMLIAAKLPLPKSIFVHGFITVNGEKISKSLGNVVDPFELVKQYGVDAVRCYLLLAIPSIEDGDFSYEKFVKFYKGILADGLGNVVARVAALGEKLGDIEISDKSTFNFEKQYRQDYETWFKEFKLDKLFLGIFDAINRLDGKIAQEEPWHDKDKDIHKRKIIEYSTHILFIADSLKPFLPDTAEKILKQFIYDKNQGILTIKKAEGLFPRL